MTTLMVLIERQPRACASIPRRSPGAPPGQAVDERGEGGAQQADEAERDEEREQDEHDAVDGTVSPTS